MERFGSSAVFLARDAALSCYACGKTSGVVADCGWVPNTTHMYRYTHTPRTNQEINTYVWCG